MCGCGRGCGHILVVSAQNAIKMMMYLCGVLSQSKTVNRRYGSMVCEQIQAWDTGPTPTRPMLSHRSFYPHRPVAYAGLQYSKMHGYCNVNRGRAHRGWGRIGIEMPLGAGAMQCKLAMGVQYCGLELECERGHRHCNVNQRTLAGGLELQRSQGHRHCDIARGRVHRVPLGWDWNCNVIRHCCIGM